MDGALWELRPEWGGTEYRFFYFTATPALICVVHVVVKNRRKLKASDVATAMARVNEVRERLAKEQK